MRLARCVHINYFSHFPCVQPQATASMTHCAKITKTPPPSLSDGWLFVLGYSFAHLFSYITGQRSMFSLISIPSPLPLFTCRLLGCCLFISDRFSDSQCCQCCVVLPSFPQLWDKQSCCSDVFGLLSACEYAPSAWWSTSGCPLRLVFHYFFILQAAASSEGRRAGQSSTRRNRRTISPTAPFDTDFMHAQRRHLPGLLLFHLRLSSQSYTPWRFIPCHHNIRFVFSPLRARLDWIDAEQIGFLAGWETGGRGWSRRKRGRVWIPLQL